MRNARTLLLILSLMHGVECVSQAPPQTQRASSGYIEPIIGAVWYPFTHICGEFIKMWRHTPDEVKSLLKLGVGAYILSRASGVSDWPIINRLPLVGSNYKGEEQTLGESIQALHNTVLNMQDREINRSGKMQRKIDALNEYLGTIGHTINSILGQQQAIQKSVDANIDAFNEHLETMNNTINNVLKRQQAIQKTVDANEEAISQLQKLESNKNKNIEDVHSRNENIKELCECHQKTIREVSYAVCCIYQDMLSQQDKQAAEGFLQHLDGQSEKLQKISTEIRENTCHDELFKTEQFNRVQSQMNGMQKEITKIYAHVYGINKSVMENQGKLKTLEEQMSKVSSPEYDPEAIGPASSPFFERNILPNVHGSNSGLDGQGLPNPVNLQRFWEKQ